MDPIGPVMFVLTAAWIVNMVHSFVVQHRLMSYLEQHHHERWCYITSVPFMGIESGGVNSLRSLPYLFSDQDNEDPNVAMLKRKVKLSIVRTLCIFVAIPVALLFVTLISIALEVARRRAF